MSSPWSKSAPSQPAFVSEPPRILPELPPRREPERLRLYGVAADAARCKVGRCCALGGRRSARRTIEFMAGDRGIRQLIEALIPQFVDLLGGRMRRQRPQAAVRQFADEAVLLEAPKRIGDVEVHVEGKGVLEIGL